MHRLLLRVAEKLRRRWWAWRKPSLRGCAIVARDADGAVLMVRHTYRKSHEWHVPTGGVRKDEHPETAARRELAEEVALQAGTLTVVHTETIDLHGARNEVTVFATAVTATPRADGREIAELAFFPPHALPHSTPEWARAYIARAAALDGRIDGLHG
ncbi:NUDIX domain-containing protein [Croceicoccus sp. BE223]|uniref:NUDIX domain-containing protein n=1 Tax=Croceicoccus sp. BE223 TaxID=2817716 RepID=UPI0028654D95|nr:NUDIX domain-containing protein [Croceicoccus sp. BE223]MDR7102629.1 8-oxo-dGTP pyrophosphatase MutT (NUDIX family) [Croceicoccus sp. BE223]